MVKLPDSLSAAEHRALRLLAQGKSDAEIARDLGVSPDVALSYLVAAVGKLRAEAFHRWRESDHHQDVSC